MLVAIGCGGQVDSADAGNANTDPPRSGSEDGDSASPRSTAGSNDQNPTGTGSAIPDGGRSSAGAGGSVGAKGHDIGAGKSGDVTAENEPCAPRPLEPLPLDLYILLDQSTSMDEPLPGSVSSKWNEVSAGIQAFVSDPAVADTAVGIQYFGLPDACDPGAYSSPEVPVAPLPDVAGDVVASLAAHAPSTLTPTYPALQGALEYMAERSAMHPSRQAAVALITDGVPGRCGGDEAPPSCPNCSKSLSALEDLIASFASWSPPVPTFLIALGEAQELAPVVTATSPTGAIVIDDGDARAQTRQALLSIVTERPFCSFSPPSPLYPDEPLDINQVQITLRPARGDEQMTPRLSRASDCDINLGDGWYYDPPVEPDRIVLCSGTCADLAAGASIGSKVGCVPVY